MTTSTLKFIALFAMLVDHIGQFIPYTPEWFGWIGRIAAPIFIYCITIGYMHTSNRIKYLSRMYSFSVFMAFLNLFINYYFNDTYNYITNNFFTPLFLIGFIIFIIDKREVKYIIYFIIWQILSTLACFFFAEVISLPNLNNTQPIYLFYGSLFGNVFFSEGGFLFIILGVLFYFMKDNKVKVAISYSFFSIITFLVFHKWGSSMNAILYYLFPFANYQWMMIAALPFILFYNGKKGIEIKYFFYVFYPVHIVILYIIGVLIK
ncbi:TraX family protein [Cytobacillus purgationiresistens]|uniref:TraX protein n=1 Tax=Cytobacillus purgationiresistens TaxID=863449 RepID=A0ABU0AKV2_9BACI|nr:TraX family protein [Cytobacillus purgationiresistens]MDQ0271877.1 hypothetical protein [Cytobacillus purgationiresistens]